MCWKGSTPATGPMTWDNESVTLLAPSNSILSETFLGAHVLWCGDVWGARICTHDIRMKEEAPSKLKKLNQTQWKRYSCLCSLATSHSTLGGGVKEQGWTWAQGQLGQWSAEWPWASHLTSVSLSRYKCRNRSVQEHFKEGRFALSKSSPSLQAAFTELAVHPWDGEVRWWKAL